jgi:hypothetical protein
LPQHLAVVSLGPHSNLANNFFASACDSRCLYERPRISVAGIGEPPLWHAARGSHNQSAKR